MPADPTLKKSIADLFKQQHPQMYYALLEFKDKHLSLVENHFGGVVRIHDLDRSQLSQLIDLMVHEAKQDLKKYE